MTYERHFTPVESIHGMGIRSGVTIGEFDGHRAVKKEYTVPEGTQVGQIAAAIPIYRNALAKAGITVPRNYSTEYEGDTITMIDEHVPGKNVSQIIKSEDISLETAWRGLVSLLCSAQNPDTRSASKAFIDAKPANFVFSEAGELYYVDTTPPMVRDETGQVSPWVPEIYATED